MLKYFYGFGSLALLLFPISYGFGQLPFSRKSRWIPVDYKEATGQHPCPIFRKGFVVEKKPQKARLIITAHGLYMAELNGKKIGKDWFTPGFTNYHRRLQYQEYDISGYVHTGSNEFLVTVGDGWWRGEFGADLKNNRYGNEAGLLAQIELVYCDGSRNVITTDSSWQCGTGAIRNASLYEGETEDTRIGTGPWNKVKTGDMPGNNLVASIAPPVRAHENIHPVHIFKAPNGEELLDFGQNLAGWVQFTVTGRPGDTVILTHAETLDKDGNLFTGNLRLAKAEDTYVLRGGRQVLSPHFTYHGFRYVKVQGYPGRLRRKDFTAVALYSDLESAGQFRCSNSLINQLQNNIIWSQRSNFFDIPTDCPQRSERFGWTGDAQAFCRTACFNQDVKTFFKKWLADLQSQQGTNGGLPVIIPDFRTPDSVGPRGGVAGWGDAATILPWTLYEAYGDTTILRDMYYCMKSWVDYIREQAEPSGLLWKANGYGDWYAPMGPTDINYIDECFFAHSTDLLVKAAQILGKKDDMTRYVKLLDTIKAKWLSTYRNHLPETQTAYVLALQFDLLPPGERDGAVRHLIDLIHRQQDHLATGFLGTPYLLPVLTRFGFADLAFTLVNQVSPPSWLYPITRGATTIWEKWDAIKPDGGFDTASLNHYSYGAVGDWLYRNVAGIAPEEPGYRKILIEPHHGEGINWVRASYRCPFGKIVSNWKIKGNILKVNVVIPPNTSAHIILPGKSREVGPGHYRWSASLL